MMDARQQNQLKPDAPMIYVNSYGRIRPSKIVQVHKAKDGTFTFDLAVNHGSDERPKVEFVQGVSYDNLGGATTCRLPAPEDEPRQRARRDDRGDEYRS